MQATILTYKGAVIIKDKSCDQETNLNIPNKGLESFPLPPSQ